jgi:WD40 repeat protein
VYGIEFVRGRPQLLAAGSGESLFLWDHAQGALLQRLEVEPGALAQGREWRRCQARRRIACCGGLVRCRCRCPPRRRVAGAPQAAPWVPRLPTCTAAAAANSTEPLPAYIFCLAQHPLGSALAASCSDGVLRVWSFSGCSLALLAELGLHQGMGTACAFSPGGNLLLSGSREGEYVLLVRGVGGCPAPHHTALPCPALPCAALPCAALRCAALA